MYRALEEEADSGEISSIADPQKVEAINRNRHLHLTFRSADQCWAEAQIYDPILDSVAEMFLQIVSLASALFRRYSAMNSVKKMLFNVVNRKDSKKLLY